MKLYIIQVKAYFVRSFDSTYKSLRWALKDTDALHFLNERSAQVFWNRYKKHAAHPEKSKIVCIQCKDSTEYKQRNGYVDTTQKLPYADTQQLWMRYGEVIKGKLAAEQATNMSDQTLVNCLKGCVSGERLITIALNAKNFGFFKSISTTDFWSE